MALARSPSYLLTRPSGYYFRYAFPAPLRPILGREVKRALCTSDVRLARRQAAHLGAIVGHFCDRAKQRGLRPEMREELRRLLDQHLRERLQDVETYTASLPMTSVDEVKAAADTVEMVASDMAEALVCRDYRNIEQLARSLLDQANVQPPVDPQEFRHFCRELLRVGIQLTEHQVHVLRGGTTEPEQRAPRPADTAQYQSQQDMTATKAPDAPRFSELVASYLRTKEGVKAKTLEMYRVTLGLWVEVMDDPVVSDATFNHDALGRARAKVQKLPPNRTKGSKAGKSLDELIAMKLQPVSANTYRGWVVRLAEFSKWAAKHRYLSFNPLDGELPKKQRGKRASEERDAFTDEQLQVLFSPDTYTKRQHKNSHYKPSHYWVPLLGLMTGARLAELTGLSLRDVEQDRNGNWLIQIRENETGRTVKTEAGERAVPILPPLLDLGFLEYVEAVRAKGHTRLFPDVHPLNGTDWSHQFSKWFGRHRERIGLGKGSGPAGDSAICFHSLRHTVITQLTLARVQAHELKALVGHEQDGVTFKRYFKGFPPELLNQFLGALSFPIDWDGLKGKWKPAMREIDRRGYTAVA